MAEYPKTKYYVHGGGSITVTSAEHEKEMGPGWVDHQPSHRELAEKEAVRDFTRQMEIDDSEQLDRANDRALEPLKTMKRTRAAKS